MHWIDEGHLLVLEHSQMILATGYLSDKMPSGKDKLAMLQHLGQADRGAPQEDGRVVLGSGIGVFMF